MRVFVLTKSISIKTISKKNVVRKKTNLFVIKTLFY
jgi:hypothetical protein